MAGKVVQISVVKRFIAVATESFCIGIFFFNCNLLFSALISQKQQIVADHG